MNTPPIIKKVIFLLVLLVASLIAKHIILDGVYPTNVPAGTPLAASVAPSLITPGSKSLPEVGKDFKILSTHYFDNSQWVVVSVAHLPDMNLATLVLERLNGVYAVVLGPGTSFSGTATQSMPPDVAGYLESKGLI